MVQICQDVGFSSYQYFVKQFKEFFYMTPMQYRKKYQKETIKYRYGNEIPYSLNEEQLKTWFIKDEAIRTEKEGSSLLINFNTGEYSIITIAEIDAENMQPKYDHYELKEGRLIISEDSDEILIKIKRKKKQS